MRMVRVSAGWPLPEVTRLSGWLVERDGRVWLERGCPEHGLVSTLYDKNPEILAYLEQWTAPTNALGVNDGEIGDVVRTALATPYVGGVSIQPQFGSVRSAPIDPDNRLTHTGVLARLGPQTGGLVSWHDLTALPCSHPHCCSVGYLIRDDAGQWRSLVALIGPE